MAAPESANNAVVSSSLVPVLTLGIPGSATAALIYGSLMMNDLVPGPELFAKSGDIIYRVSDNREKPLAHPGLLLNMTNVTRSPSWYLSPEVGSVHAKEQVEWKCPAYVGDTVRVEWELLEMYEKRNRLYRAVRAVVTNDSGDVIMIRTSHSAFIRKDLPVRG